MVKSVVIGAMVVCLMAALGFAQTMPVPAGEEDYWYGWVENPVVSADPAQAQPVSVGNIAKGGENVNVRVNLPAFSEPVDIYIGIQAPEVLADLFLIQPDNSLRLASEGLVPWKANTVGPIDENLFGDISSTFLPEVAYYLYLAITPAGTVGPAAVRVAGGPVKYRVYRTVFSNHRGFGRLGIYYGYNFPPLHAESSAEICYFISRDGVVAGLADGNKIEGAVDTPKCPFKITGSFFVLLGLSQVFMTQGKVMIEFHPKHKIEEVWTNECPEVPNQNPKSEGENTIVLPYEDGAELVSEGLLCTSSSS